ncbi:hypothetical protein [Streptomyces olivaceus]|uniref:hypothetical protein n=1 Tax=Streptomyces olivaceus TaxID=47716 RepID=UPI0006947BF9|nr:hypothetical protein [Streptomyces olivaceus]MBZ6106063.1 hypothetical protein [Streptomyces olivaceus]MBZ6286565.1 hypothetical protein [Streptomyces olivaceus]
MEPERTDLRTLVESGVLLTTRALKAGWPRSSLSRRLQDEGWVPLRHGAWAERSTAVDLDLRLKAAQLMHPELVVSHRTSARLWAIEQLGSAAPERVEFTDPGLTSRRRLTGVNVHRLPLADTEVETVGPRRLRITSVARTLGDLLRSGPRDDALVAVESALTRRRFEGVPRPPLTTRPSLTTALAGPLLGGTRARQWLSLVDLGAGSPAETVARLRMHDAGLHPETQAEVRTRDGRRRYLDFFFRAQGLAVEIEGYAYHGSRDSHRRDLARFNEIAHCPEVHRLLRFPATAPLYHPTAILQDIHRALSGG